MSAAGALRDLVESAVSRVTEALRAANAAQDTRLAALEGRVSALEERLSPAREGVRPATRVQAKSAKGAAAASGT